MEQREKQFITSLQSDLAKEGEQLCKEIENSFVVCDEFLVEKARCYCNYIYANYNKNNISTKCKDYLDKVSDFSIIYIILKKLVI